MASLILYVRSMLTSLGIDYTRRGKKGATKTNRARTPDYAWLPFRLHCDLLRRFPQRT